MRTLEEKISEVNAEYHRSIAEVADDHRRRIDEIVDAEIIKRQVPINPPLGDKK